MKRETYREKGGQGKRDEQTERGTWRERGG